MNNPDTTPETARTLLDRIAEAVRGVLPMSSSLTHDVIADAVLAVLPPSSGRAALLHEAIARVEDPEERAKTTVGLGLGWESARDVLRRMLAETDPRRVAVACPGYETAPNRCQCPCEGCTHNCAAHQPAAEEQPAETPWGVCPDCRAAAGPDCDCLPPTEEQRPVVVEQPDTQETRRCICGDGGDCFVPLGHYADCPQAAS